jgi:cadaverine:lysine antiporter
MVKNPKRTVPLATMLGTAMAGVYIARSGYRRYPAAQMAASGAPFAISASTHSWRLGCAGVLSPHLPA